MAKKTLISGRGVLAPYAYLTKADTKFNDRGLFKAVITLSNEDPRCQSMIAEILEAHAENWEAIQEEYKTNPPKAKPGKKPLKPYEGDMPFCDNEDGTTSFTFKSYASFQDKKTQEIVQRTLAIVDGKGKKLASVPQIAGGSEVKLKYSLVPYGFTAVAGASVKLQLEAVMLLKLVEFGGQDDEDWGDETEEDAEDFSGRTFSQRSQEPEESEDEGEESESEEDDGGDF